MARNIGIVEWFGKGCKNYGFIKFLSGNKKYDTGNDIFFHRDGVNPTSIVYKGTTLLAYPHNEDLVSFDATEDRKGLKATNVTVLNVQSLANEVDFADEADYKNFREKILSAKGTEFFDKFIVAVSEESVKK